MLKKFSVLHGPKEWKFKDPDSGKPFTGTSMQDVASKVRMYRNQNEMPELEFLEAIIENYLCRLPENHGGCVTRGTLKRGFMEAFKGGVVVLKSLMYNSFAPQEVADERSAICAKCPLNVFPDKGPFIEWSDDIALQSIGERKSKYHDELGNCEACSCPMRAKVFYDGPIELKRRQVGMMPDYCWQKKKAKILK